MSRDQEFFARAGTARNSLGEYAKTMPGGYPPEAAPNRPNLLSIGAKRWAANNETFWGASQTYDELPSGLYRCSYADHIGPILLQQKVETDNLLDLPDDASAGIIAEFGKFWRLGDEFAKRGFLFKRGYLLWGPPGSGKTSCVNLLVKRLIEERSGIVIFVDEPRCASACLQMARKIEPNRPVVAIMEDLDALIGRYGENGFLALLDGEAQVNNIVFVGTTNYPERLDRRFVDRPSRFDTIRYVGMPSADARRVYLATKEPSLADDDLSLWVSLTDGFSVAHLKELIIAVKCFGQPVREVVERLELMQERKPTSEDSPDKRRAGFLDRVKGNGHTHYDDMNTDDAMPF